MQNAGFVAADFYYILPEIVLTVGALVVLLIGMDVLARRSHGQSITALERVFRQKPGSLKLSEAQRSVSGFWSMNQLFTMPGATALQRTPWGPPS